VNDPSGGSAGQLLVFGVKVTVAVSRFGDPDVHALLAIGLRVPLVGPLVIVKANWQVSTSVADNVIVTGVPANVDAVLLAASGASFTQVILTVTRPVSVRPPSETV
jgi:hypothetical protein